MIEIIALFGLALALLLLPVQIEYGNGVLLRKMSSGNIRHMTDKRFMYANESRGEIR